MFAIVCLQKDLAALRCFAFARSTLTVTAARTTRTWLSGRSLCTLPKLAPAPMSAARPRLVLHFDVNKTILFTDEASGQSFDDVL